MITKVIFVIVKPWFFYPLWCPFLQVIWIRSLKKPAVLNCFVLEQHFGPGPLQLVVRFSITSEASEKKEGSQPVYFFGAPGCARKCAVVFYENLKDLRLQRFVPDPPQRHTVDYEGFVPSKFEGLRGQLCTT